MFTLEYEIKGLDVWWFITLTTDADILTLGRGIIPVEYWDAFTRLLTEIRFVERRIIL